MNNLTDSRIYPYELPNIIHKAELYRQTANKPLSQMTKGDYQKMRGLIADIMNGIASGKYDIIDTGAEWRDPSIEASLVITEKRRLK